MGDLQEKIRRHDQKYREEYTYITDDEPDEDDILTLVRTWAWVPVLLIIIALLAQSYIVTSRNTAYRQRVIGLAQDLSFVDRMVLEERLNLQDDYVAKSNDPEWFAFPSQDGEKCRSRRPAFRACLNSPLLKIITTPC